MALNTIPMKEQSPEVELKFLIQISEGKDSAIMVT
jgi:hypothetical protein